MKCQILFSGKNKKNVINLSSAENAQRVVKVKLLIQFPLNFTELFHPWLFTKLPKWFRFTEQDGHQS